MSFVDRVRDNDPELEDLRLTEEPQAYAMDVAELAASLKDNKVISFIRLDRDFLPSMNEEEISVFFDALGKLPSLKEGKYIMWCLALLPSCHDLILRVAHLAS